VNFYAYVGNNPVNGNDPSGKIDSIYSAGALGINNPTFARTPLLETNYIVVDRTGATYPMGEGTIQRTVVEGRPFDAVIGPNQTAGIVNWGISTIQNNRLFGATGNASIAEVAWQSLPGHAWDTKQDLSPTNTFIINNKAEQRDYVGNVIWGAGLNSLGVSRETALMGAQIQGAFSGIGKEDPRDQEAINFGYSWPGNASAFSSAYGGFVLYPNKPNNNSMTSVYRK
jgi:hypothetical protein